MENKFIVVGLAGSGSWETWAFDDLPYCKLFCTRLAKDSGRPVFIIEGKIIGKFDIDIPVKFTEGNGITPNQPPPAPGE